MKLAFLSIILFQVSSFAGSFIIGNGGGGVKNTSTKEVYLLDFAEAGIEKSVAISCKETFFTQQVAFSLLDKDFPVNDIACKISEIYNHDKILAYSLLVFIQSFSWSLVDSELEKTPDINTSLKMKNLDYVQLANRRFSQISIHKDHWLKMTKENQTGLIIHEAIYGLLGSLNVDAATKNAYARTLVAYLFSLNKNEPQKHFFEKTRFLPTINVIADYSEDKSYFLPHNLPLNLKHSRTKIAPEIYLGADKFTSMVNVYANSDHSINIDRIASVICNTSPSRFEIVEMNIDYFNFELFTNSSDDRIGWSINLVQGKDTSLDLDIGFLCDHNERSELESNLNVLLSN